MRREGILFVGDQGAIMAGFHGQDPQLFAKGKNETAPAGRSPTQNAAGARTPQPRGSRPCQRRRTVAGQFPERGGRSPTPSTWGPSPCGPGEKVLFDSENMKITNVPGREPVPASRIPEGWEL